MLPLVTDSNYFVIISIVTNQIHFQVAMFAFNTVLLLSRVNNGEEIIEHRLSKLIV